MLLGPWKRNTISELINDQFGYSRDRRDEESEGTIPATTAPDKFRKGC